VGISVADSRRKAYVSLQEWRKVLLSSAEGAKETRGLAFFKLGILLFKNKNNSEASFLLSCYSDKCVKSCQVPDAWKKCSQRCREGSFMRRPLSRRARLLGWFDLQ